MKYAHIADPHWGLNYPGPTPEARFNDITRVMNWCADRIIEEHCDVVLFAGDFFKDGKVYIDRASVEIKAAVAWLRKITAADIQVLVISGTPYHDAIAAYELIKEMNIPGVRIMTEPGDGVYAACLPGMNRAALVAQDEYRSLPAHEIHQIMTERITEKCQQMLGEINTFPKILVGHLTYDLADKGFEDVLMQHEPILTPEAIRGYDLVCLGHIHRPQQNGNVFYCGSPERLNFNDEYVTPGFWIHEATPDRRINSAFIETPARKFKTWKLDQGSMEGLLQHGVYFFGSSIAEDIRDAVLRIQYTCPDALAKQLDKRALEQAFYDAGAFYVSEISGTITESERTQDEEVTAEMGPIEALEKWCNQPEIGIDSEEVPFLLDMTRGLLEGAMA